MTEKPENHPSVAVDKTGEFFSVGPPLHAVKLGYVRRAADDMLYQTLIAGNYAHVIAPDRTGKSSLIAATSARLQNNGFKVAVLNLSQIAERDGGTDAGRWYYSIAYRLLRQLRLKVDLQTWWQDNAILSNRQRLVEFFVDVILQNVQERIVVFVDEIQYLADLPFEEHLLPSIRAAHNARGTEPDFSRLSFAMFGECDPQNLALDPTMSPFMISQEIKLGDFTREDLNIFAAELNLSVTGAELALDRIFDWTAGQPYLSQKLARSVAREQISGDIKGHVDRIAMHQLGGRGATRNEPHLGRLHRLVIDDKKNCEPLLNLYGRIRKGIRVPYDSQSTVQRRLLATGLAVEKLNGDLAVRNKVYESVFTARWANENLPLHWRGPAIAAVVMLLLTAIPFAYTQLLPRPYLQVMSTPAFDLETISGAYVSLRSFPGHAIAADRMFQSILEHRARQATDRNTILNVAAYARQLPDSDALADSFLADYWDRQVGVAMRTGQRDEALLASLESLVVSTPARRRRASTLVGDDYTQLLATNPAQDADGLAFNAEKMQLTYFSGAQISQWSLVDQALEPQEPWTMSALEVTPLVRRVVIDREGVANRVGLTVNASHARLDDIRMKLIAPSGRTIELDFDQPASAANDEVRISGEQLSPLIGEPLNGTWSLSLRDESTGVSGHLVGWKLSLNSQVVVEDFERGLDIPDPVERLSENLWFSPDGRYAIARALQSDSARLWDLNSAEAARTIAVPANEQVLGLSENAEYLVTTTQDTINMWRTVNGRRSSVLDVGAAGADAILGTDGEHLLVPRRSDIDTQFELWSLASGEVVSEFNVAGAPALIAMDATGKHLAIADYDRAVRIWDISAGELVSQIDLTSQPSQIILSASGGALGVVHGDEGVSLWRTDQPEVPVLQESGRDEWQIAFSPSGERFLAGNIRHGFQAYRSSDGALSGPPLDAGMQAGDQKLLAFSADEKTLVTASRNGISRFWNAPLTAASVTSSASSDIMPGHQLWSASGDTITAISPGGESIAIGDHSGHVHVLQVAAAAGEIGSEREEISFLGHRGSVVAMAFNNDASLVASAGSDGTVRIWDGSSGLPRPFYGSASASTVGRMVFSPSSAQLAILGGQRVWIMDVKSGAVLADIELGESHAGLIFADDSQLYLGSESGALRSLYADRTGNWHLRNVWQGADAIRQVEFSVTRQQIVIVDASNEARLLDIRSGGVGSSVLQLPDTVTEIAFSRSDARVLFKTGLWIHRALLSPGGLHWTDAIRAPKSLSGSTMAFDHQASTNNDGLHEDYENDRVLVLTRDTGFAKIAELHFDYDAGPALFGNRKNLIAEWTRKVRGETPIGFVREGF
jgi:WD40 repeat protein